MVSFLSLYVYMYIIYIYKLMSNVTYVTPLRNTHNSKWDFHGRGMVYVLLDLLLHGVKHIPYYLYIITIRRVLTIQ